MAIHETMYDLDKYFHQTVSKKIILNDYPTSDVDILKDMLMTVYDATEINTIPKCSCERTMGAFREGTTCMHCGTEVESMFNSKEPLLWLRHIDGMPRFINPTYWKMLSKTISSKVDILRWIGDSSYNPPTISKIDSIINMVSSINNFERSYSWLCNNLGDIIVAISAVPSMRTGGKKVIFADLLKMWEEKHDSLYSQYLPLLNKRMFVMESTTKGKFTNLSSSSALYDLAITFVHKSKMENVIQKERVMARTVSAAAEAAEINVDEYLSGKPKIFRKHMYGTRSPFTARAVITPIIGPHKYNSIEIPWGIGVTLFRPHLLNILVTRKDMLYSDASSLLMSVVHKFDPLIYECLETLIEEAPGPDGPAVLFQRNPSLLVGSALRLPITRFKTDPNDTTISVSLLNAKLPNYDIDGDEMNLTLCIDNLIADELNAFEPHHSLMVTDSPGEISGLLNITGPVTSTISNALFLERKKYEN